MTLKHLAVVILRSVLQLKEKLISCFSSIIQKVLKMLKNHNKK